MMVTLPLDLSTFFTSPVLIGAVASVGFIALLGIAVLNGVLLVRYFNQLHNEGMSTSDMVVQGAKRRLRPVLMTAFIPAG